MKKTNQLLVKETKKLFQDNEIDYLMAYGPGSRPDRSKPLFIKEEADCGALHWDPFCSSSLPTYLFLNVNQGLIKPGEKRIGIVVKGCDSRALLRVLQDHMVEREQLKIIGIPCAGMVDPDKLAHQVKPYTWKEITVLPQKVLVETEDGKKEFQRQEILYSKCLSCSTPTPVLYDILLGDPITLPVQDKEEPVREMEALSSVERKDFWNRQFQRCIRCYACRNACSACNCRSCIFEEERPVWLGKGVDKTENFIFHFTRAFHVAGRCVDCGECERVCPMEIPLMSLNRKIQKDIKDLFAVEPLSREEDIEEKPPLGFFLEEDREEFL